MQKTAIKDGRKKVAAVYDSVTDTVRTDTKGKVRYRVEQEVIPDGIYDIWDLIADMAKRLNLLERGFMTLMDSMDKANSLPQEIIDLYGPLMLEYTTKVKNGEYKSRTDLEDGPELLMKKLMDRDSKITKILEEEGY